MATVDDLVGNGLSEQQVEDLMRDAGPFYRAAALRAIRRHDNKASVSIAERGRARLVSVALRLDTQASKLSPTQRLKLYDLRQQLQRVEGQQRAHIDLGSSANPIAYSAQQEAFRGQAATLMLQIGELLPHQDVVQPNIPKAASGEAILLPLVNGNDAALLLLVGDRIDAVPSQTSPKGSCASFIKGRRVIHVTPVGEPQIPSFRHWRPLAIRKPVGKAYRLPGNRPSRT